MAPCLPACVLQVYTHRKAKAVELMVVDALLEADPALRLSGAIRDPAAFCRLDDGIIDVSFKRTRDNPHCCLLLDAACLFPLLATDAAGNRGSGFEASTATAGHPPSIRPACPGPRLRAHLPAA